MDVRRAEGIVTVGLALGLALALGAGGCNRTAPAKGGSQPAQARQAILAQEEAFRHAKLDNDVPALGRLLADDYVGINHNGNIRDKTQALALFRTFDVKSLEVKPERVQIGEGVAIVTGSQVERTCAEDENLLFLRVYVARGGGWHLLSNTQLRRLEVRASAPTASPG